MTAATATEETAQARDGRDTRWDAHRVERRAVIADAAVRMASETGRLDSRGIARRAGVPRTHLYRHFKDVAELRAIVAAAAAAQLERELCGWSRTQDVLVAYRRWAGSSNLRSFVDAAPILAAAVETTAATVRQ